MAPTIEPQTEKEQEADGAWLQSAHKKASASAATEVASPTAAAPFTPAPSAPTPCNFVPKG